MDNLTFIAIDTETTGLSFMNDRVIQFGASIFIKGKLADSCSWYIRTEVENHGYAINGIARETIEDGKDHNWSFWVIAKLLQKAPQVICAYNAPFDLMMLANEFRRHSIYYDFSQLRVIDPLVIFRHYFPYVPSPMGKLAHVITKYGVHLDGRLHDAGADAALCGRLWIAQRWRHMLRGSPLGIHRKCATWHAEWTLAYEKWLISKGKTANIAPWPYNKEIECFQVRENSLL